MTTRTANECVTQIAVLLKQSLNVDAVFKYDMKPDDANLSTYIAVNNLPFVYGRVVNDVNVLNVNIHAKKLRNGKADVPTLDALLHEVLNLIPVETGVDDCDTLVIDGVHYVTKNHTQPMPDTDGTYFINVQVRAIFSSI